MTAMLIHCLFAATVFLEQEIPGLRFGPADPLTGVAQPNFRQLDLDGDGAIDLLLPGRVLFQRDGLFPAGSSAELPPESFDALCDAFGNAIYLRNAAGLRVLRWENNAWVVTLEQEMAWPDIAPLPALSNTGPSGATPSMAQLARFLLDIDADGIPEIVAYARDGVHVYRMGTAGYDNKQFYNVFPPTTTTAASSGPVWPAGARGLSIPGQQLDLKALWRGSELTVVSRQEVRGGLVRYRSRSCDIAVEGMPTIVEREYPLMMASLQPIYLNRDETLDFAGGALTVSAAAFTEPIYDSYASTDGGKTIQRIRTKSFSPRSNFVDFDGDGDLDIVTHRTEITSGGLRESLNRYFFQRSVGHQISFSVQNDRGEFVSAPMMTVNLEINLDKVPYREGSVFRRYRSGDLIDVTGDFNGDGYKDLLVQEAEDTLAIYLSRAYRFSKHPVHQLAIHRYERFYIADIDSNGLSDVVLIRPGIERSGDHSRVYLARQTAP